MGGFLVQIFSLTFFFNLQVNFINPTLKNWDVGLIVVGQILREEKQLDHYPGFSC
jgi:hypothetical protein